MKLFLGITVMVLGMMVGICLSSLGFLVGGVTFSFFTGMIGGSLMAQYFLERYYY